MSGRFALPNNFIQKNHSILISSLIQACFPTISAIFCSMAVMSVILSIFHENQGRFIAESAGLEPGALNPVVVKSMAEKGCDISNHPKNSVFDYLKEGRSNDVVVKVCEEVNGQRCPIFPSAKTTLVWSFADPSSFEGTDEEKLRMISEIQDQIETRLEEFIRVFDIGG
ncbi:MAG: arsenate reductase ArsC [Clostridiales bacterium]|nr:arsenate reductase ArsC [Clostridiales bacterium]